VKNIFVLNAAGMRKMIPTALLAREAVHMVFAFKGNRMAHARSNVIAARKSPDEREHV
jgi:hypothetical protein